MLQLATLEEVAPADSVGDKLGIGNACDGPELDGGFGGEAFVGVYVEHPRVLEGDVAQTPVLMGRPVVEGALENSYALRARYFRCFVSTAGIIDNNIIAPGYGLQASRQIFLFIFCENKNRDRHGYSNPKRENI